MKAEVGQEGEQMPVGGRDEEDYSRRGQVREATGWPIAGTGWPPVSCEVRA